MNETTDILTKIASYKREEIAAAKQKRPFATLEVEVRSASAPRGFVAAILRKIDAGHYALIAEVKKASPSKGLIRNNFDPAGIASAYERGGAACLSVLTDAPSFQGDPQHLVSARAATALPALRKDFMLDIYQVLQARAWGADCILIILGAVDDKLAHDLERSANRLGMDALLEVHNEHELERALRLNSRLVGINNRDLKSFHTTLDTTIRLAKLIPSSHVIVSESGIFSRSDIERLSAHGISTFLVGESLMRQRDVETATRALIGQSRRRLGAAE
ncbi:MAG TPA: indole-3-glycerol phosphate synthase TrpC [Xanthobacteraceae bacterium]